MLRQILQLLLKEEREEDKMMKKEKRIAGIAAPLLVVVIAVGIFSTTIIQQSAQAYIDPTTDLAKPRAPMAASQDGNNVYVVCGQTGQETGK
jgi:hypothetical protein